MCAARGPGIRRLPRPMQSVHLPYQGEEHGMDIIRLAKYFYGISNIPVALYRQDELLTEFSVRSFKPNVANYFARPILTEELDKSMDMTVTADFVLCGFVRDKSSGDVLVLGPVLEFPCLRKKAYRILEDMREPYNRVEELMRFLEKIPTMPLTTFMKNVIFLNYVINEETPAAGYQDEKLVSLLGKEREAEERDTKIVHNSREWDRQLEACVEFGRTDELETFLSGIGREGRMGIAAKDSLRSFKNISIASIALVARAAARGGMDYEAALTLSDEYSQKIELTQRYDEVRTILMQAFFEYTSQVEKIRGLGASSKLAKKVAGYVREHVYEPVKVNEIADFLGNNSSYLCRSFKKDTGKTLSDYINEVKLEEAKRLLSSTKKSIVEISAMLGYSSQAYFTTLFKKRTGMTPAEFREKNGK